jgi:hypothetical protein
MVLRYLELWYGTVVEIVSKGKLTGSHNMVRKVEGFGLEWKIWDRF